MKSIFEVGQIVDGCLTTEALKRISQQISAHSALLNQTSKGFKAQLWADLLEYAGETVRGRLKRELSTDEVVLIFNRVQQFLIARGLD